MVLALGYRDFFYFFVFLYDGFDGGRFHQLIDQLWFLEPGVPSSGADINSDNEQDLPAYRVNCMGTLDKLDIIIVIGVARSPEQSSSC